MKSVLISIQPKWCELIASGKKTIEVRKTRPKIETPFKCYIYCTSVKRMNLDEYVEIHRATSGKIDEWHGKVIGEFICDYISPVAMPYYECVDVVDCQTSCLSPKEILEYANHRPLYGWHISDLIIYDEPKELSEFWSADKCPYSSKDGCTYKYHCFRAGQTKRCGNTLTRPPQSWCYVEEVPPS